MSATIAIMASRVTSIVKSTEFFAALVLVPSSADACLMRFFDRVKFEQKDREVR